MPGSDSTPATPARPVPKDAVPKDPVPKNPVPKNIAVLGTGTMGVPMAARLIEAGFSVTVWNRTAAKTTPLAQLGANVAADAATAAADRDVVITMLADGPVVDWVLTEGGVAEALRPGSLMIDMSSIPPATARAHGALLERRQIGYLDAPVSGGERGARDGSLAIMAGGTREDFERANTVFTPLGKAVHVGGVGSGQIAKLCNQTIVGITIGAVAEATLLAQAAGADAAAVHEALLGGFADSRILREHGQRMLTQSFDPGAKVTTQLKDMDTVAEVADDLGLMLPFAALTRDLFASLARRGDGNRDHSALYRELGSLPRRGV